MKLFWRSLRWLWPCIVVACFATLLAGTAEALSEQLRPVAIPPAIGLSSLLALPGFLLLAIVLRLVAHGWQARVASLLDADGGAPRLFTAVVTGTLALVGVSALASQTVFWLFRHTQFGAWVVAIATAVAMTVGVALMIALAPWAYDVLATPIVRFHRRWPLFTARRIVAGVALVAAAVAYLLFRFVARAKLGHIDFAVLIHPLSGLAGFALWLAGWRLLSKTWRRRVGVLVVAVAGVCLGFGLAVVRGKPGVALKIWADCPVAGLALDRYFELETIRTRMPLAAFKPIAVKSDHPDIVLVTIDTIRADRMSIYGGRVPLPGFDALAARASVFGAAFAPGNVTRRSMPAIFTGIHPTRVKGRVVGWALKLDPRHVTLAERLREGGYDTAAFVCCGGFWGDRGQTGWSRGIDHLVVEYDGEKLTSAAIDWLAARKAAGATKPAFIWLHYIELHNWPKFVAPQASSDRTASYDRALQIVDKMIGRLDLRVRELAPNAVLALTGDHGEALFDHGTEYHSTDLFNSQLRVPMLIVAPGQPARVIDEVVSGTDVTPTLLELAGFLAPRGPDFDGRSLADLVRGLRLPDPEAGFAFAAMIRDRSNPGGQRAIVVGPWKLYQRGSRFELYNFRLDPAELRDVAAQNPVIVARLKAEISRMTKRDGESPFVD